ncbi:hypothetical protein L798_04239 [Zootermopsis nevadensis]|uniref:Uncharacterized protein n=1 Tax=Zootermopsis nevadensis TaxID=136037 RepID=A0A067RL24_ZOONE|nr:hypothetical protein L798_04239 [Zootermopsis nevadensis]
MGRKQRQPHYILSWHKVAGTYEAIKDSQLRVICILLSIPNRSRKSNM